MESLVHIMLSNALVAAALAIVPLAVRRLAHSPALVHILWLLVLLKLITPPVFLIPVAIAAPQREVPQFEATISHSALGQFGSRDRAKLSSSARLPAIANQREETLLGRDSGPKAVIISDSAKVDPPEPEGLHFADTSSRSGGLASLGLFSLVLSSLPRWHLMFLTVAGAGSLTCWTLAALPQPRAPWPLPAERSRMES